MQSKRILFIGDSLTEFFDWQRRFPGHEVVNLGVAGETVEGLLSRTGDIIRHHQSPDFIFLMTGINNVAMEDFDILDAYKKIVEKISSAYPDARLFVQSLLPTLIPWVPGDTIEEINHSLRKLAERAGKDYLDIHAGFIGPEGGGVKDYFLPDGVHLSDAGYAAWAKALEGLINT